MTLTKAEPVLEAAPVLPRVNLLPPEIEERRRFRRLQSGLAGAGVATVGLVGLLYVGATGTVEEAQADLDARTASGQQLAARAGQYAHVTAVHDRTVAAQAMLAQAMGSEVRWSRLLNALSLSIPDGVWVKDVTFTQAAPAAGAAAGTPAGIGTVTITGTAFGHDDVAVWLESLAEQEVYADATFSAARETVSGSRTLVDFSSSATLTDKALSRRYLETAED